MNKLIVILGPTASGKTELAIKLAKFFNGEIISADSRQIYREMDIGTNKIKDSRLKIQNENLKCKISKIEKPVFYKGVPHYLIDVANPDEEFTVAQFKKRAIKIIKNIQKRGKTPFLVGGTGLYIQSIVDNLVIPRVKPDKVLRNKLSTKSNEWLFKKLKKIDPLTANEIDRKNKRRLIRALEVCLKTKKRFSELRKRGKPLFDILQIGLKISRPILYQRINQRVEKMIRDGLVDEVKKLYKKYSPSLPSLSGIGYQEIIAYLQGKISLPAAVEEIKKNTRHFAKRQMTWFRRDPRIVWLKDYQEIKKRIAYFLKN
ncbi:MAG: tRNA (adenosine(37)-N6)-dimethylallyltransferase MiaA [Patescibacteria group bacterium]|nr:tRNA (adenosine(37)-N6)-dimethylallyltransferase MiaA [Patescibacteria group bacterium]